MTEILEAIVVGLVKLLTGWLGKRQAASAQVKAANTKAEAEANSAVIRDRGDAAVEQARDRTDEALRNAQSDADGPGGLRQQSLDVQAAIDKADGVVR